MKLIAPITQVFVCFGLLLLAAPSFADHHEKFVGEYTDDFSEGADNWKFLDPKTWRVNPAPDASIEILQRQSEYKPPQRSPGHVALLKDKPVGNFTLTFRVRSTLDTGPHRDCCVFFGFQGEDRFYYTHLGARPDPRSGQIMVVDQADRAPLTENENPVPWTDGWHTVRLVRNIDEGTIRVYFDDLEKPFLETNDARFGEGLIGLGSFDDLNQFTDVKLLAE